MESAPTWEENAACRTNDLDWQTKEAFFADTAAERRPAKKICAACPVKMACLTAALERGETWGVWGGCDEIELRRALRMDTNGTERARKRPPRCPGCRSGVERLKTSSTKVSCTVCHLSWTSAACAEAVEEFRDELEKPKKRKQLSQRTRLPKGRSRSNPVIAFRRGPQPLGAVSSALAASAQTKQ